MGRATLTLSNGLSVLLASVSSGGTIAAARDLAARGLEVRVVSQIGLDIRRGMPLPLLACLDVLGKTTSLREEAAKAQVENNEQAVFCDGFTLRAILLAQTMTARISRKDRAHWRPGSGSKRPMPLILSPTTAAQFMG
jgi:hypothetical protein